VTAPSWIDGLRLLAVLGVAYGAWQGIKNRPPPIRYNGKKYFPLADGRFANAWGLIVKDETVVARLQALREKDLTRPPG
jgi:hypothetical protein